MKRYKRYAALGICAAVFIALGLWIMKPAVKDQPAWLSFSADTDGIKAWRELTATSQPQAGEWKLRWERLPQGSNHLLVAVEPQGVGPDEWEALKQWLSEGNHFILLDRDPNGLSGFRTAALESKDSAETDDQEGGKGSAAADKAKESEGGKASAAADDAKEPAAVPVEAPLLDNRSGLTALALSPVRITPDAGDEVLVRDSKGVLASRMKIGSGSAALVLEPEWLQNGEVLKASHLDLMWPLFAEKRAAVLFDETHHGYGVKPGLFAVYPDWLLLASIQLAAALILWLWLSGKRFGPVHVPRAWTVRRGDETVRALAVWYLRSGLMEEALEHGRQRLRQLLAQRWGLDHRTTPAQAAAAARSRWSGEDAQRLEQAMQPLPLPHGRGKAARQEFMRRSRDNAELMALLEGGKQPGRGDRE
jgi:hypothetical protein